MIIKLSPQVRESDNIWYEIEHQKITATINDISDTFDFTAMPDGKLQVWDDEGNDLIETTLNSVPILGAEKTNGVLTVEILFSIDMDEKDKRLLFPEPMILDEFNDLMEEISQRNKAKREEEEREERLRELQEEETRREFEGVEIDVEEVDS